MILAIYLLTGILTLLVYRRRNLKPGDPLGEEGFLLIMWPIGWFIFFFGAILESILALCEFNEKQK